MKMTSGNENKAVNVECIYTSGGCNRSPHCISWRGRRIIYGCANAVNVAETINYKKG